MLGFGQNLYLWRVFKGFSQEELAKRSSIPRPNLSAIEKGKREVSLTTLRALAWALGIEPGVLVNGVLPVNFHEARLSRGSLEKIASISLGEVRGTKGGEEEAIGAMLASVTKNRINARSRIYKRALKNRNNYTSQWLILKSAFDAPVLNNLLSRLDKRLGLKDRKPYG